MWIKYGEAMRSVSITYWGPRQFQVISFTNGTFLTGAEDSSLNPEDGGAEDGI